MVKKFILLFLGSLIYSSSHGVLLKEETEIGHFSGRISKINKEASFVRVKVDFDNSKYLNKKDKVEFWDQHNADRRCKGYIVGKSNEYILLRIPEFQVCLKHVLLTTGAYLKFFSQDLVNNVKMGQEVMTILTKKRLALNGKLTRKKKDLDSHMEKVNAVNKRYDVLREKLESEWRQEIAHLEEDRATSLKDYQDVKARLDEVDYKIERYRIQDENLELDRWALDSQLYYKK